MQIFTKKNVIVAFLSFLALLFFFLIYENTNKEIFNSCHGKATAGERLTCLKAYIQNITIEKGANAAIAEVKILQKTEVIDDCHLAAHFIGNAQYLKYKDSVGEAFGNCSAGCTEGCFHGVMEAYISDPENILTPKSQLSSVCDEIADDSILRRQCIHGIGHGLYRHNANPIEEALDSCEIFESEASICRGGVFMENMNSYLLLGEVSLIKKLPTVCFDVEKIGNSDFTNSCYKAVGEGLMFYTGHDLEKSKKLCRVIRKEYVEVCTDAAERQLGTNERQVK